MTEEEEAMTMMNSKWKFRPPPRGVARENLRLCEILQGGGICRLGDNCVESHSPEELEEWKLRWEERHQAEDPEDQTYSDKILHEVLGFSPQERVSSMAGQIAGVELTCSQDSLAKFSSRNSSTVWHFSVKSLSLLKGVTLLGVEHLQHFALDNVLLVRTEGDFLFKSKGQECVLDKQEEGEGKEEEEKDVVATAAQTSAQPTTYKYTFKLKFHTKIFGTFKQTLVLDFGVRPLLSKTVVADVFPCSAESDIQSVRETIISISDPWDTNNSDIEKFEPSLPLANADEEELLTAYPAPKPSSFDMTEAVTETHLSPLNYAERLHQLLYIEEMSQRAALDGFNALIKLQLASRYLMSASPSNSSTAKYARPGELFGRIELNSELSEDSQAGRLILTKCSSIFLKFDTGSIDPKTGKKKKEKKVKLNKKKIWECLIEDTAKSVIYVRLSCAMVKENKLTPDMKVKAEVQFKLSRTSMAEMHYAVDKVTDLSIVYPDIEQVPKIPWSPSSQWCTDLDVNLNPKQREAIIAITAPLSIALPPILIHGPYGTGKTYTLGNAIEHLLKKEGNKILVCTRSNSAADLYIKEYLDPHFMEGKSDMKLLRVYYHNRWVQTVHPTVQKYCLVDTDTVTSTRRFRTPSLADLEDKDVVVATLSTSRTLAQLLPPGHFTHILLDEAAQAMETEAIMPLVLATAATRVVLAGDHMQLEPDVTSDFATEKRLNVSLLERLYDLYPADFSCKILLCENYRSHEAIVDYTSKLFYEQKLVASGKPPAHSSWYPLTFFTARGEDVQDSSSTSYYNNSEVYEVVDRLAELKRNWPKAWGRKEETEIGVVTPYHDQVMRIRSELRKKKLHNISVERVLNVQGKQYRAIIISTVRTRSTCFKTDENDMKTLDYGFLSSAKLLNTAITRAQSLVAVVGDPVALVSIGKCRKLWEKFIDICDNQKSLHGFTKNELRSHLEAIELKKIYGLNPLAPEFIPKMINIKIPKVSCKPAVTAITSVPEKAPFISPTPPLSSVMPPMPYGMPYNFRPPGPPRFLPPPPTSNMHFPYIGPPLLNMRGMPYNNLMPGLASPWPQQAFPPLSTAMAPGPPYTHPALLRPPHRTASPMMSRSPSPFPLMAPNFPGFFPPFPPGSGPPFLDLPPAPYSTGPGPPSNLPILRPVSSNGLVTTNPPRAVPTAEKILPRGVDLALMLSSPDLQQAWHSHLLSAGSLKEAEAFLELLDRPAHLPTEVPRPHHTHSPDSGCFSSPPDTNRPLGAASAKDDNSLADVFESLLADFETSWPSSTVNPSSEESSVPLYMRRAHAEEQEQKQRAQGQESPEELCILDESILAFALEGQSYPDTPQETAVSQLPTNYPQASPSFPPAESHEPAKPMSYAGVLRTPPKKDETDPIVKIRNLGTMGSSFFSGE